jgi:hypothetical protein
MVNSQHDTLPGFAGRQSTTMPSHRSSLKVHRIFLEGNAHVVVIIPTPYKAILGAQLHPESNLIW